MGMFVNQACFSNNIDITVVLCGSQRAMSPTGDLSESEAVALKRAHRTTTTNALHLSVFSDDEISPLSDVSHSPHAPSGPKRQKYSLTVDSDVEHNRTIHEADVSVSSSPARLSIAEPGSDYEGTTDDDSQSLHRPIKRRLAKRTKKESSSSSNHEVSSDPPIGFSFVSPFFLENGTILFPFVCVHACQTLFSPVVVWADNIDELSDNDQSSFNTTTTSVEPVSMCM
jgi:hypothetical protein